MKKASEELLSHSFQEYHVTPQPIRITKLKQPNRTTKVSQKLKLFPDNQSTKDSSLHVHTYDQHGHINRTSSRLETEPLLRCTAYCTASLYTPYSFNQLPPPSGKRENILTDLVLPEMFVFDYGVIVLWGMTLEQELSMLKELEPFEDEKLEKDDTEIEEFQYRYDKNCQPCICNDIITLRHPSNYLVKLTVSHSFAQSVKMTLFERSIEDTISEMKYIPRAIAEHGHIQLSRTSVTKKIGQLFIMRINVNLVSNILDTPEIFWSEPTLEPLYSAIRSYLEISQRAKLLNQRVEVINDLLEMLKDHLNCSYGERLEWIIIILIAFEIVVAVVTTTLDTYSFFSLGQ
ncbi:hypothetical protein BD560DRAFT_367656 [Blakeslea trispora]|nr:hypothetical protein BD560DRAFT_367656 [Blakeslea trispora]